MHDKYFTNALINETSPYLQQHAHNPVEWHPWNEATLQRAVDEDKPLLISIGYAACHWCHVMAHETFEDEETAKIMNDNFMCIKVDREERPDVDAVYMRAVQAMTGSGGWPLHAFALPDGKPFFGGTYFPRSQWQKLCTSASNEYKGNRKKLVKYADRLDKGLRETAPLISFPGDESFPKNLLKKTINQLKSHFDLQNGGMRGAPKFPMPSLNNFLLNFGILHNDLSILSHVKLTLQRMAMGGIYDHIGGGFARYSTDPYWKVPHFEKMLYDNAQLISLYSKAYRFFKEPLFQQTVEETTEFLLRELRTPEGLFASSLDADSEGVEGKYTVWGQEELKKTLGDLYPIAEVIFNINPTGLWEHGQYILLMQSSMTALATELNKSEKELKQIIARIKSSLFDQREHRTKPGLDHKSLTSWNGLAIQGLAEAYDAFHSLNTLKASENTAEFMLSHVRMPDGGLFHTYTNGQARIIGFLEDYSMLIGGLISLYQSTFNEKWIYQAKELMEYSVDHFFDHQSGFFFFTSDEQTDLTKRDIELTDGVIPSSNSTIAHDLLYLSHYFENDAWEKISNRMVLMQKESLSQNSSSYSHWASLYLTHTHPFFEVAINGPKIAAFTKKMKVDFHPNILYAGSSTASELPILKNRYKEDGTHIYICRDKVCAAPVGSPKKAIEQIS
jgi:uncharacterized protein YyaL (SSP411 family)